MKWKEFYGLIPSPTAEQILEQIRDFKEWLTLVNQTTEGEGDNK